VNQGGTGQGQLLLAGDVGGTKTDLAIVSTATGPRETLAKRRYPSAGYPGLAEMSREFLAESRLPVQAACFDVAGPVFNGTATLTNLRWQLEESSLAEALGVERVWLINDLVAIGSAIPLLQPEELHEVKGGQAASGGAIAVLAPGTGLGEAFLMPQGDGYQAHASEGGHGAFAPTSELEIELLRSLWKEFDHVSYERVASGVGIPNLYAFLRDQHGLTESAELARELGATDDDTRPILQAALRDSDPDPLAAATLELFLRILGTEATNLALKVLSTGGIYLAGGIAQALRKQLSTDAFLDAFVRAGRFGPMLEQMPIQVIMGPEVALLGAAGEGLRRLGARLSSTPPGAPAEPGQMR
jgi:glucokinase